MAFELRVVPLVEPVEIAENLFFRILVLRAGYAKRGFPNKIGIQLVAIVVVILERTEVVFGQIVHIQLPPWPMFGRFF